MDSGQSIIYSGREDVGANHRQGVAIMTKDTRKALTARQRINSRLISAERESGVGSVPPQTSPNKPFNGTPKEKGNEVAPGTAGEEVSRQNI